MTDRSRLSSKPRLALPGPCSERLPPVALPGANLLQKGAKHAFIVTMTGQRPIVVTHIGSYKKINTLIS